MSNSKLRFREKSNNNELYDHYEASNNKFANYNLFNIDNSNDRNNYLDTLDEVGISADNNRNNYNQYVDMETNLKKGNITQLKEKNYKLLNSRPFVTSPYMGAGSGNINGKKNIGIDTTSRKSVGSFADVSIDRFTPLVPNLRKNIQNPKNIIPEYWVNGGESTRAIMQNVDYYKNCGIKN